MRLYSTGRGAALYLFVWLCLGVILGTLIVFSGNIPWINGMFLAIPITLIYAFSAGFSAYYLCRAYPLSEKSPAEIVIVFLAAAVVSGFFWTLIAGLWNNLWNSSELEWTSFIMTQSISALIFGLGVLLYLLSAVVHYLVSEFERARTAERRELESQLMAQDAELRMLRTQIDPHFLFNSLNSISALTSQNPSGAREMTLQLADFFRQSLGMAAHEKISLDEEIALCMKFLAIEKVRFGSRLKVTENVEPEARKCLVLPMIIQPLVENAVKHGIGNLTDGGTVEISAKRAGSILQIVVENSADQEVSDSKRKGIGLNNVRQRLSTAYGHEARIDWERMETKFRVAIAVPAETSNHGS